MRSTWRLPPVLLAVLLASASGCSGGGGTGLPKAPPGWTSHQDPRGFGLIFPADWRLAAADSTPAIEVDGPRDASVVIWPFFVQTTLDQAGASAVLTGLAGDVQPDATWEQPSAAFDPRWVQGQLQATAEQSRIVGKVSDDIANIVDQGYWARQATLDALSERRSNATLSVEDVADPTTGARYQVESGANYYWVDERGDIVGTNDATAPDVDFRPLFAVGG